MDHKPKSSKPKKKSQSYIDNDNDPFTDDYTHPISSNTVPLSKYSMEFVFTLIIMLLITIIMITLYSTNYGLLILLYDLINKSYFTDHVINPISNYNTNISQIFSVRIKSMEEIMMESKLANFRIALNFLNNPQINATLPNTIELNKQYNSDYFINITNASDNTTMTKLFTNIVPFFNLFIDNMNIPLDIREVMIYDIKNKHSMNYCKEFNTNYKFYDNLLNKQSTLDKIQEDIDNNKESVYIDYAIQNSFDQVNQLNYMKAFITSLKVLNNTDETKFLIILRYSANSFKSMLNKQNRNQTILYKLTDLPMKSHAIHFIPTTKYFETFFTYGIKNTADDTSDLMQSNFNMIVNFINFYLDKFLYLLLNKSTVTNEPYYYNQNWENEYVFFAKLYDVIVFNYNESFTSVDHVPILKVKQDAIRNENETLISLMLAQNDMQLGLFPKMDLTIEESNNHFKDKLALAIFQDIVNISHFSMNQSTERTYKNSAVLIYNDIFNNKYSNNPPKKIIVYQHKVNQFEAVIVELLELEQFNQIKQEFYNEREFYQLIILCVLLAVMLLLLIVFYFLTRYNIKSILNQTNKIALLKEEVFKKKQRVNYDDYKDNMNTNLITNKEEEELVFILNRESNNCNLTNRNYDNNISTNAYKSIVSMKKKQEVVNNNDFEAQLAIISYETKLHLEELFAHINTSDDTQSELNEHLEEFKSKNRLFKEFNYPHESDYISASMLFKKISEIDPINIKDISYNLYYNPYTFMNDHFETLRYILEESVNESNVDMENKRLTFTLENVIKIMYFVKRKIIGRLVNDIFDNSSSNSNKLLINEY